MIFYYSTHFYKIAKFCLTKDALFQWKDYIMPKRSFISKSNLS